MTQHNKIHLDYNCKVPFWKFKKQNGEDYCKVCNHTIIDFTKLSEQEIINILKEKSANVCGKFYDDQIIIDEKTKKGPSLPKIILASTIASVSAFTLIAQKTVDPVKTEQLPVISNDNDINQAVIDSLPEVECLQIPQEQSKKSIYDKRSRIYIGKYYLSWKFPFIHKPRRGKFIIQGCPSF